MAVITFNLCCHANHGQTGAVGLRDHQMVYARLRCGFQMQVAINAKGGQRDVPIPAKIASGFADQVAVVDGGVVDRKGQEKAVSVLAALGLGRHVAEGQADVVLPFDQHG